MPGHERLVSPSTMYGGSWVVTPMPWPVRWMKYSPYPASVITCAGHPVDLLARDTRPDRLERGLLGRADDLVDLALLVRRLADVHRAGGVGAVAVLEAAEVEDHRVAVGR